MGYYQAGLPNLIPRLIENNATLTHYRQHDPLTRQLLNLLETVQKKYISKLHLTYHIRDKIASQNPYDTTQRLLIFFYLLKESRVILILAGLQVS